MFILFLVKLGFGRLTVEQKLIKAYFIIEKLTGNPDFPVTDPTLLVVEAAAGELGDAITAAEAGSHQDVAIKNQKEAVLDTLMAKLQSDINTKANGSVAKILGAGFEVRKTPTPASLLGPVENLTIKLGANPGEIILKWKRIKGAMLYVVVGYIDNTLPAVDKTLTETTKSKVTIANLQSGMVYHFRIMVINSAGVGPKSETISIKVY